MQRRKERDVGKLLVRWIVVSPDRAVYPHDTAVDCKAKYNSNTTSNVFLRVSEQLSLWAPFGTDRSPIYYRNFNLHQLRVARGRPAKVRQSIFARFELRGHLLRDNQQENGAGEVIEMLCAHKPQRARRQREHARATPCRFIVAPAVVCISLHVPPAG